MIVVQTFLAFEHTCFVFWSRETQEVLARWDLLVKQVERYILQIIFLSYQHHMGGQWFHLQTLGSVDLEMFRKIAFL